MSTPTTAATWLQLVRAPNLFTVPGDVLAGVAVAGGLSMAIAPKLALLIIASLLLYSAGLLLNDWYDQEEDARERPHRPIPSGAVSADAVKQAAFICILLALVLSLLCGLRTFLVALALTGCVVWYNRSAKKHKPLGIAVMSSCRFFNVLLGAALVGGMPGPQKIFAICAAVAIAYYIVAVAWVAVDETSRLPSVFAIVSYALTPFALAAAGIRGFSSFSCWGAILLWLVFTGLTVRVVRKLLTNNEVGHTSHLVGGMIRNLILAQAFLLASSGASCFLILALAALWPLAGVAGRKFYGS